MEILSLSFCVLRGTTLERIHGNAVFYVSDSILQAAKQSSSVSISVSSSVCLKGHKTLSYTVSSFFQENIEVKVAQSCLTLVTPYSSWNPGQNTGVGSLSLLQGIYHPGIKPRSPTLQADSLPAEPQGKPTNTRVGSYPFSRGSS